MALWMRENPYFFMVNALQRGMSAADVQAALGEPCGPTLGGGVVYRKRGVGAMLLVVFDVGGPFAAHT